jgi:uncharacterized phage protein gp47/JayE
MAYKTFDEILAAIIQDYNNLDPSRDTSQGSDAWIDSACLASAIWGIYKYQEYIKDQISPITCESDMLDSHCAEYGITRVTDETDSSLLARLLSRLQHPPAGGNRYDYIAWAKECSQAHDIAWVASTVYTVGDVVLPTTANGYLYICTVAGTSGTTEPTWPTTVDTSVVDNAATWRIWAVDTYVENVSTCNVYSNPRGPGTIDIIITTDFEPLDGGTNWRVGQPSNELLSTIYDYIDDNRPLTAYDFTVQAPEDKSTTVTITAASGKSTAAQRAAIVAAVIAYMRTLAPGDTLYLSQINYVCVNNGVSSVTISAPSADVTSYPDDVVTDEYQRIWPYDSTGTSLVTMGVA